MSNGYRSPSADPRELRPRAANRKAALAVVTALILVVLALALFT